MIKFILPSEKNEKDVLSFYSEFEKNNKTCIGFNGYKDYNAWLKEKQNRLTGKNLPEGYVRESFYLCYEGDEMIGVFSLKFELTEFLRNYGGHIGYAVRPSQQNNGYATKMLYLGLKIAEKEGFTEVLCVCDDDNIASEKVILKNGGIFENKLFDSDENVYVKRYLIKL